MDKAQLQQDISTVFDEVMDAIAGTPDEVLNTVPFEDSWTIGQVTEHIVLCSRGIPDTHAKAPDRPYNENEAALESIFLDMEQKTKAAPAVTPKPPPHQKQGLLEKLKANKMMLIQTINEKELSQLCLDMEFPFMGYLTRYEWLRFVQVHTQRHLSQITNIQKHL